LERRGREAVSVFGGAFFKKLPGVWGEKPHKTAFSFRQAFSFGPADTKEKASNK
jgi:hypothetical protein